MSLRFFTLLLLLGAARIIPAQCISFIDCPAAADTASICDFSDNDPEFWNDALFLNPIVGNNDLFETPVELSATASNTPNCMGPTTIQFELYLDLDGNGSQETVVLSSSLPATAGTVRYDNLADPLNGGTEVLFDSRPVAAFNKYRFYIEQTTNGNHVTGRLRFTSGPPPGVLIDPILPNGRHKIKWIFSDAGGSTITCVRNFVITDCKKPTVVCLNGLSVNLMPSNPPGITIWVTDLLQYTQDNVSPSNNIHLGVRKSGTGTGFPDSLTVSYNCDDLGTNLVEIWAKDDYGNADYCETYISVVDISGYCPNSAGSQVSFCVKSWCDGAYISGIDVGYLDTGSSSGFPVLEIGVPNNCTDIHNLPNTGYLSASFFKNDDMLNGVSVADALKILWHLAGIAPVNYPYGYIAADVNNSNSVSIADAVAVLELIAGVPTGATRSSWTLVDSASVALTSGGNPYLLSQTWETTNTAVPHLQVPFTAIKTGDLNCDALPNFTSVETEDREVAALQLPDITLQAGETVEIPLSFVNAGEWLGLQLGLRFDPTVLSVTGYTSTLDDTEYGIINANVPGGMNLVWFNAEPVNFAAGSALVNIQVKANAAVQLKNAISLSVANQEIAALGYDATLEEKSFVLDFTSGTASPTGTLRITPPSPNPVGSNGTTIRVSSGHTQAVVLSLYDINGRVCFEQRSVLPAGENTLPVPASAFSAGSGVYVWRVMTDEGSAEGKVVR